MEDFLDNFEEVRECDYKGEHYSVRDNGAVMRHGRPGKRVRKDDSVWTFGVRNEETAYMMIGTHRVHIIVATAFFGPKDSKVYVVDHIDTNRCNNRISNLRWFTRLENALNNPITRRRIEILCGGDIQKFIDNPACLRASERNPQTKDLAWMRVVTAEEAKIAYKNLLDWAEQTKGQVVEKVTTNKKDSEWMYKERSKIRPKKFKMDITFVKMPKNKDATLNDYFESLKTDEVFAKTAYGEQIIIQAIKSRDEGCIGVTVKLVRNEIKPFAAYKITFIDGRFEHEFLQTCFDVNGALQRMTETVGEVWTGPDSIDNYC